MRLCHVRRQNFFEGPRKYMRMAWQDSYSFTVIMWENEEAALIEASRKAYQENSNLDDPTHNLRESFTDGTELIRLDDDETIIAPRTAKEDSVNTSRLTKKRAKKHGNRLSVLPDTHEDSLSALEVTGGTPVAKKPSKRELDEYRRRSAGSGWFGMPAFPGSFSKNASKDSRIEGGKSSYTGGDARAATEKEMRQQLTAIRLRNALDPKRFYRGSGGTGSERSIPKYAQLGKVVGGGLEPTSVLTKTQRANSVVGELMRDSGAVSYSKRKFGEVRSYGYSHSSNSYRKSVWLTQTIAVESHIVASGAVPSGMPSTHPRFHMNMWPREGLGCVLGKCENKMPTTLVCDLVGSQWSYRFGGWLFFQSVAFVFTQTDSQRDPVTTRPCVAYRTHNRPSGLRDFASGFPYPTILHSTVLIV